MRKTRIFSVVVFVLAVVLYVLFQYRQQIAADNTGPTISMDETSVTISVEDGEDAMLAGVTAVDQEDGDVSDSLLVETVSDFIAENTCRITIAAFDSAGNVTKATREIVYSDYIPTRFELSTPLRFAVGSDEILSVVSAYDVLDGDLSEHVKVTAEANLSTAEAGDYQVEFSVMNSAGEVSTLEATATLYDTSRERNCPQILLTDYLVYVKTGEALSPWDYVKEIDVGNLIYEKTASGDLECAQEEDAAISPGEVSISDNVDYNTPGTYEITYSYTNDIYEGSVRMIVIVEN